MIPADRLREAQETGTQRRVYHKGAAREDSLAREKRGRVVNELQAAAAVRARISVLLSVPPTFARHLSTRGAKAAEGDGGLWKAPSRESVLKVIGWTKSARLPTRQARYIGRARDSDQAAGKEPLPLENESGDRIAGKAAIDAEMASWALKPDSDNLTTAARKLAPEERQTTPVEKRLLYRQAAHLIFSIPARSPSDPEKLRATVRAGLAETVGEAGYRYVFAIHTDHSARPHAHIIIKATAELERDSTAKRVPRLRLGPSELQTLRHVLTQYAQQHGIDVIATRREDRAALRQDIIDGKEPLRANRSWHQRLRTQQGRIFEKSAPGWYQLHGPAYERRRALAADGRSAPSVQPEPAPVSRPGLFKRLLGLGKATPAAELITDQARGSGYFQNFQNVRAGRAAKAAADRGDHPSLAALSGYFARTHKEPEEARASFVAMYREAPKLAVWAATNHPAAFGEPNGIKPGRLDIKVLKEMPASERPKPEAWTKEHERAQRDEVNDLKWAAKQARAQRAAEAAKRAVGNSIELVARQAEAAIRHDPAEAKDSAARLRALARDIVTMTSGSVLPPRGEQLGRTDNLSNTARGATDKAARYKDLEDRLRQRDRATAKSRNHGPEHERYWERKRRP